MRKSIVWIPVLLVGSMVYWTLALGFGGLSLMSVTSDSLPCPEGAVRDSFQSITVNLGDSSDSQVEVDDQEPRSLDVELVSDHEGAAVEAAGRDSAQLSITHSVDENGVPEPRGSGRRPRSDRGPGETAF